MELWITRLVDTIFSLGLLFNVFLFIPQAIKIYKKKDASELSLLTFAGFNIMQLFTAWHAYLAKDYLLMTGFALSFVTCGIVTGLIIKYKSSIIKNNEGPLIPPEDLIAVLPNHIYWLNKENIYQGCNDVQAKTMGLNSRNEIFGKRNKDIPSFQNHPDIIEILDTNNIRVMQSGKIQCLEEIAHDANGVLSTYRSYKMPLKDSQNNVIGLLGASYKIDDIKAREDELITEKENVELTLKSMIAHLPGHVYWKDKEGRYLGSNDKQAQSLGFKSESDLIGKTDFELPWPEGSAIKFREHDLEVMRKDQTKMAEENAIIDGKNAIVLSQKVPLKNKNNKIYGILGISLDITELKQAQEREKIALQEAIIAKAKVQAQEEIQKALLTFSGSMSHDLRSPISTIGVNMALLERFLPTLVETYKKSLGSNPDIPVISEARLNAVGDVCQNVTNALKQADSYIDATLKIIKGAARGSELLKPEDLVPCSIEDIIRRVAYSFTSKNSDSKKIHYNTDNLFTFLGNAIFMSRILQNMIKNAFEQIKLKEKGEIFIWCENGSDFNYLKIKDTAGGITPATLEQLFNGFNSTKQGGTGLGLSSAKQIMQAFGGDISCDVVDGDCIEFSLSFPIPS